MVARAHRRLPGFRFIAEPSPVDQLPRMDIAVFVGFAGRGAFHVPILLEESRQFSETFGHDLPLAWDVQRGEIVYAYLGSAVRAFFRNGGERCWVIRVPHSPQESQTSAAPFLDPELAGVGSESLISEANYIRYESPTPRALQGIHAALDLDEVTLIAVPDAVHRGWSLSIPPDLLPALESPPPARPDWWHFLPCDSKSAIPLVREPAWEHFHSCNLAVLPAPELEILPNIPSSSDSYTLAWSAIEGADVQYELEESYRRGFETVNRIYTGSHREFPLRGRSSGDYYYRVRATAALAVSDWSNGVGHRIAGPSQSLLEAEQDYSDTAILEIQRAVLRLCAARGDLFAILALPQHYRLEQASQHVARLKAFVKGSDERTLSYGCIYHPWLLSREETSDPRREEGAGGSGRSLRADSRDIRLTPPDGAALGIIARRALDRGAWIAPANEAIRGIVALSPQIERPRPSSKEQKATTANSSMELELSFNLIAEEPRGFMALGAYTLSEDVDWQLINVRRLMMLLRRLALRLGPEYVFESNHDAFRRRVQRGFESLLDSLFVRGAFAGSTAETSYQVVADVSVNAPASIDVGRFIVELRVAPVRPLTFVTIRLVQEGDTARFVEERS